MKDNITTELSNEEQSPFLRVAAVTCTCFFVGMHNKTGMSALDSKTMTGKVVDKIINNIQVECKKTNLFDADYFPKDMEIVKEAASRWHEVHAPKKGDVIVLLGKWVSKNFEKRNYKVIEITHPAGVFGTKDKFNYVKRSSEEIDIAVSQHCR